MPLKQVIFGCYLCQGGYVIGGIRLSVCLQNNSKSSGRILMKFSGNVNNGTDDTEMIWITVRIQALLQGYFIIALMNNIESVGPFQVCAFWVLLFSFL